MFSKPKTDLVSFERRERLCQKRNVQNATRIVQNEDDSCNTDGIVVCDMDLDNQSEFNIYEISFNCCKYTLAEISKLSVNFYSAKLELCNVTGRSIFNVAL